MFGLIRGLSRARKLSKQCSWSTSSIVNHLIKSGYDLKLEDTAYVFLECYAYCLFLSSDIRASDFQRGVMIENSKDALRDWLREVFLEASGEIPDDYVNGILESIDSYWSNWFTELVEEHTDLAGSPRTDWIPVATAKFLGNVDFYFYNKYGETPDKFTAYLMAVSTECVNNLHR